jgi:hypothetical protein
VDKAQNRRGAMRRRPRGKPRVECRLGTSGLRPNLAEKLLDLSQTGASLLVKQELSPGVEVEVRLISPGRPKPFQAAALVVRSIPAEDGKHTLSVHFEHPLDYATWQQLT